MKQSILEKSNWCSSKFPEKVDLASLKPEVDKLDINKLEKVPTGLKRLKSKVDKEGVDILAAFHVDLNELRGTVKNGVVKKYVYNVKIKDIENKTPDVTNLATNTTLNANINEVKSEITSVTNLVTNASFNVKINEFENEIPHSTNLTTITVVTAI